MSYESPNACGNNLQYIYENGTLSIFPVNDSLSHNEMWDNFEWPEDIKQEAEVVVCSDVEYVAEHAFKDFVSVRDIDFGSAREIGKEACIGCYNLEEPDLSGIDKIGEGAFKESGVISVDIPKGVSSVGRSAFANCPDLISVNVNSSTIGEGAFAENGNLKYVSIGTNVNTIEDNAFSGSPVRGTVMVLAENVGHNILEPRKDLTLVTTNQDLANQFTNEGHNTSLRAEQDVVILSAEDDFATVQRADDLVQSDDKPISYNDEPEL